MANKQLPPCTFSTTDCSQGWVFTPVKRHHCRTLDPEWGWAFVPEWVYTSNFSVLVFCNLPATTVVMEFVLCFFCRCYLRVLPCLVGSQLARVLCLACCLVVSWTTAVAVLASTYCGIDMRWPAGTPPASVTRFWALTNVARYVRTF